MNNLKRVLSLALSGIMLVGMMAMGASAADFTDAEEIEHNEAVGILVALNIINGQDDGSFNPKGDVTRGQMAKMIAVAMQGGSSVSLGTKGTPSFTDIKGHWAESFIEYCADLEIISGRGDGTFDPDGKVTGMEATKMVLTALGYNAEAYKLTGAAWSSNTDELARKTEVPLYEELGNDVVLSAAATRDTAAQLIWNGLQSTTRKVTPEKNTNTGEVTWGYGNGKQMLTERYGATVTTAPFNGNYYTGHASVKGEIDVGGTDIPYDFDISHIGEEVKVIWKDGKNGGTTKNALDSKDVIYGVFATGASKVVNAKLADVKNNKNSKAQINVGGTKYDLDATNGVDVVVNYTGDSVVAADTILTASGTRHYAPAAIKGTDDNPNTTADESANSSLTDHLKKGTGDAIKLVLDDDKVTKIYVTTTKLAAVTAVNSEKITMNNSVGTIKFADHDVEEGLKKGDVVTVTTLYKTSATADDSFVIVKKAETVEGEVKGWKDSETVTLDDTKYDVYNSAASFMLTGSAIPDETGITTFKDTADTYIGEDVRLFMVNGYVGAAIQISESASNYSLITEVKSGITAGSVFGGLQLQVMDGEGTKTIITVSDDSTDNNSDGDIDDKDYNVGDIITYTMNKDNEAEVTVAAPIDQDAVGQYDDSTKAFGVKGSTLTVTTADCVLFVQTKENVGPSAAGDNMISGASFKAYKIRDLKSLNGDATKTGMTTVTKDGKVVAAFVNTATGKNPAGATTNTVYGIVSNVGGRVKDYFTYTVKSNGETYTVNSKDGSLKKGDLVYFDKTNDNNYADTNVAADQNKGKGDVHKVTYTVDADTSLVWIKEAEKDTLTYYTTVSKDVNNNYVGTVANQTTLAMDEDVAVVYVDVDNSDSAAEGSMGGFDTVTGYANAVIITETQGTKTVIIAVFVETSNTADILKK